MAVGDQAGDQRALEAQLALLEVALAEHTVELAERDARLAEQEAKVEALTKQVELWTELVNRNSTKIRPRLTRKSDGHAIPSTVRPISAALPSNRLLRSIRPDEKLPVRATADLQRPGSATDVAVPDQFTFALRVDVDLDNLEAVRTG